MGSRMMTTTTAAQRRSCRPVLKTPPWLWVWLVFLLIGLLRVISGIHTLTVAIGGVNAPAALGGAALTMVTRFEIIFGSLLFVIFAGGVVTVAFPQVRGRWVERRFMLLADDRPVIAEMQRFVDSKDPSIRLRVSLRADQVARIYPMGWRKTRVAVFRPLVVLWRHDQKAAQAVLLHEMAHRRQGDQLITGLGSPFVWLVRIGVPAYLVLVLIPSAVFLVAGGGVMASFIAALAGTLAVVFPSLVILPIIGLWLAELDADQQAVEAGGHDPLQRALQAAADPHAHFASRVMALLSHPPRRLRLRCAVARPGGASALRMAVWPAAVAVFVLVLPFVIDAPLNLSGQAQIPWELYFKLSVHVELVNDLPLVIATAALLLAWPTLAGPWERLWSSGPRRDTHQPWWPSLAAASLPVGMLLLFLAPIQVSQQQLIQQAGSQEGSFAGCSPAARWLLDGGLNRSEVSTEYEQLLQADGNKSALGAAARRLDTAIQKALHDPPPGSARSVFITSMSEYRIAAQDMVADNTIAADSEISAASSSYSDAIDRVSMAAGSIQASVGC